MGAVSLLILVSSSYTWKENNMNQEQLKNELKSMIEKQMEITIASPDEKLDIDSFTMMLIVTFINEKIGIILDMEALDFDDFNSLNSLIGMIDNKAI